MVISVQPNEISSCLLTEKHVQQAVDAIQVDGYVVVENNIKHKNLEFLQEMNHVI